MKIWEKLLQLDVFGREVEFFFKGQQKFKTKCGCFVTAFIILSYLIIAGLKLTEFFGEIDPIKYVSETRQSMEDKLDLKELGFTFAVENIQPEIGRIELVQIDWDGKDGMKHETQIELIPCDELSPYGLHVTNEFTRRRVA